MPVSYQIVPEHVFPHQYVQINDNTEVVDAFSAGSAEVTALLCVFTSPKGRDRQMYTITDGLAGFMREYGLGPFSVYGQPLLNAYAAASTGQCLLHCMRVTAADAGYSYAIICAQMTATVIEQLQHPAEADQLKEPQDEGYPKRSATMKIFGETLKWSESKENANVTDLSILEELINEASIKETSTKVNDTQDKKERTTTTTVTVPLFTVAYIGRGTYGSNIRFRIVSDKTADKENNYKNYVFQVYTSENGMAVQEEFHVTFVEDAIYSGESLYAPDVINSAENGSNLVRLYANAAGFRALFDHYVDLVEPETVLTEETFDALLGIDKYTREGITGLTFVPENETQLPDESLSDAGENGSPDNQDKVGAAMPAIALNSTSGIALYGGTDGLLAPNADLKDYNPQGALGERHSKGSATRDDVLADLYMEAFSGKTDPYIKSKNHFPTTLILDANYPVAIKQLIAALAISRTDCMAMLDCGTGITTKNSVKNYVESNLASYVNNRVHTIEAYNMKVRDPYSQKSVTVTGTYWIAGNYPTHIYNYGGKHRPMAGNRFGVITGYIANSVYPLFDEDLEPELMDELAEMHVNFAKYNANQEVCRAMQDTRQDKLTVLSEQNNMLIVLDIKRDAERISAQFEYDFSEPEDLARFNISMEALTDRYSAAQVRSITATYSKNEWEAERNYIHLNIALVCKDLVRTTIIEIDVNRSATT